MKHTLSFRTLLLGAGLIGLALVFGLGNLPVARNTPVSAANVDISPEEFARFTREWSEPEGFFDSDNFISNETSYLHVMDELQKRVSPGGIYLGVGPDQNFSYIAHTRPSLAIIVDIRRQNMLQHLFFKALFEQASSRFDFLALLFARSGTAASSDADLESILKAVRALSTDETVFQKHVERVKEILLDRYKLPLSSDDLEKIEYVYRTFWTEHLDLRFSSIGRGNASQYPTFESLILQTDREGRRRNVLASEESFQWLKTFQKENRLIPIVGDFAGSHAFKAVAAFLAQNGLQVSAFYTSNVEFYLFGRPAWDDYMQNVEALPVAPESVFIRAYFSSFGRRHPSSVAGHRSTSLVHALPSFLDDYRAGRIPTYWEVVSRDQ